MMTDLHAIQTQIVKRIGERPVGSASRFRMMDAADAVSKAIEAEAREDVGAEIVGDRPETQAPPVSKVGAELEGNQA